MPNLQSNHRFFELRQGMTRAHFEHIILAFAARKRFAFNSTFEIERDKVSTLNDVPALDSSSRA